MKKEQFKIKHGFNDNFMEKLDKTRSFLGGKMPVKVVTKTPEEWAKNKWIENEDKPD